MTGVAPEPVLQAYENAARIYCAKRALDPEELFPVASRVLAGSSKLAPQWHFVATELHDLSLRLLSLKEAVAKPARVIEHA